MDQTVIVKTVVSFFVAGLSIGGLTLLAERLGSKKGGLVGNLPCNIMVALVFVALVQDAHFAAKATDAVPIGMLIDTLFLVVFILVVKYGVVPAVVLSLGTWLGLAFLASGLSFGDIYFNIFLYIMVAVGAYLFLEYTARIRAKEQIKRKFSLTSLLLRAVFAGSVVAGTILISTFAGTFWVGLFSTFPATMLSAMVILTVTQGSDFARALGKVMVLSSTNIIVYALGVSLTYPVIGILWGTVVSFAAAFLWVLMLHPVVQRLSS